MAPLRGARGAAAGARLRDGSPASLPAFLDTLLPADGDSPSATALGVESRLVAAFQSARRRRLLARGCAWLDSEGLRRRGRDFAALDQTMRDAIVAAAAASPPRSLPRVFFDVVRGEAFALYYSDQRSWPALGYEGPPQPAGFPDHASPPRKGPRG